MLRGYAGRRRRHAGSHSQTAARDAAGSSIWAAGRRVRYFVAISLVETLYRGDTSGRLFF
jgi:hypothetical protein